MDVTVIGAGRWALSRPLLVDGGWTTYAQQQMVAIGALRVDAFWPPRQADGTPLVNAVLVRMVFPTGATIMQPADGNTRIFPRDIQNVGDVTMGELTNQQRTTLRNVLESWLTGYTFTDWDGTVRVIPAFTTITAAYNNATTLRQVARDVYRHFAHSASRPRPAALEDHNTEYTDDFSTDPSGRWTVFAGFNGFTWDSTNQNVDVGGDNDSATRYSANDPGSIEHEAQVTVLTYTDRRSIGPAVRMNGTNRDAYGYTVDQTDNLQVWKWVSASRTNVSSLALSAFTNGHYGHMRMAASGAAGANVALAFWFVSTGSSSAPGSDPGWQGTVGLESHTYTDTAADRLDDSTHIYCGMAGRGNIGITSENDWFKERAISDRAGAGVSVPKFMQSYRRRRV